MSRPGSLSADELLIELVVYEATDAGAAVVAEEFGLPSVALGIGNWDPLLGVFPALLPTRRGPLSIAWSRACRFVRAAFTLFRLSRRTPLVVIGGPPKSHVIEHRQWWNLLVGNPMGYLPESSRMGAAGGR